MRVLYLSYTGLLEPLGQSQVLAYLRRLAGEHEISLISFEKPGDWADRQRRDALLAEVERAGVRWHPLPYHGRFALATTAYDVARGLAVARRIVRERRIEIVHARSYIASTIALPLQSAGVRFLFDMRGFWPDERVDAGTWRMGSPVYRAVKRLERTLLTRADAVVSLTEAGAEAIARFDYLQDRPPDVTVIPTCADLDRFSPPESPPDGPFTLGYVGNAGGWYRFEPVVAAFAAIRQARPDARLLVVNRGQHEAIRAALAAGGVPAEAAEIVALDFQDVPDAVRRMHAGAFFLKPAFSKEASAPTRLAELLGCGVPCLVRGGVGDAGRIVEGDGVGVVVTRDDGGTVGTAALRLAALAGDPAVRARCRATAERRFSVEAGAADYDALYRRLAAAPGRAASGALSATDSPE